MDRDQLVCALLIALDFSLSAQGSKETALQHLKCTKDEFFTICFLYTDDHVVEAIKHATRDEFDQSQVIMSCEGGFNGYFWKVARHDSKIKAEYFRNPEVGSIKGLDLKSDMSKDIVNRLSHKGGI
jgi:hypothetical protein